MRYAAFCCVGLALLVGGCDLVWACGGSVCVGVCFARIGGVVILRMTMGFVLVD